MEEVPDSLKNAAIAQIVAGLLNIFVVACVSYLGVATVCGLLTLGFGGQLCGFVACLLVPFGVVEIIVGALALTNPKDFGKISRLLAYAEIASILFGGLTSAVIGGVVVAMTNNDEVTLFLES